jgi:hypothetical protein
VSVFLTSKVADLSDARIGQMLAGLPETDGFQVLVKPLRYREKPHLAAQTEFDAQRITLQLPEPFLPFGEVVAFGAKRRPGRSMRFIWLTEGVTFRTPREVLRFLYDSCTCTSGCTGISTGSTVEGCRPKPRVIGSRSVTTASRRSRSPTPARRCGARRRRERGDHASTPGLNLATISSCSEPLVVRTLAPCTSGAPSN